MSVLSSIRDTAANLSLERALSLVREQQLQRMLAGHPMSEQELREQEREAILGIARILYCDDAVMSMGIANKRGVTDHRKDYVARATAAADAAVLISHQRLCQIPMVGDPAYQFPRQVAQ
ncbi:hypothetical protein [Diaphorobacter aerolatus]|uniref:Uncharacterized protein n=1 Tax=Diaphorobacter aerolatus TaxID=1288495 RepID=A0A7H0GLJ6_9BURK|nr:hypothetical protein [Diaphorobacter aerolatus]QNP49162.1 hypothetical protein H9K75_03275 [Diaphorobacter aerolatus]